MADNATYKIRQNLPTTFLQYADWIPFFELGIVAVLDRGTPGRDRTCDPSLRSRKRVKSGFWG